MKISELSIIFTSKLGKTHGYYEQILSALAVAELDFIIGQQTNLI